MYDDTVMDEVMITKKLIPLRGTLRFISNAANDPITLYAHDNAINGIQAHLAKPAINMQKQQNRWSGRMVQFHKEDNRVECINTALACTHSLYIRELVNKTGIQSLILNCSGWLHAFPSSFIYLQCTSKRTLPFHWHTIKATIEFMRTGSLQLDCVAISDMLRVVKYVCAMFFRIAQLSRLIESFVRQRSKRPETVLEAYKAIFHDEQIMHSVTYETQTIVSENMAHYLSPHIEQAIRKERSTLALMTSNELYYLLARDAQRVHYNSRDYERAACQRFQVIMRWIQFQEQTFQSYNDHMPGLQSTFFARTVRLLSCVHFEYMRPKTRRHCINYLRSVSPKSTSTFSLNALPRRA
ncbi:unnamed protein product [Acanthocheilonema viteae]|uniref:Uncharacterized protein n=1 Tax=Acanthocheilonema viteae TaxID=6277 RepID=A0A498SIT5_ACAVI|nr:unnamed protein product [Acanthocheilonema viteae]